jgi:hypothetical protein
MIKQENQDPEPETVIQDRILATTFFIGTVVTIGLMISAVRMIYAFVTGEDISKYKNNVVNALIGMILVFSAYIIVRVIQYLVRT